MLFQPSFGTCPSQQLAVIDDFDGYQGQAFLAFKQDPSEAKRRLDDFLMGFGLLILLVIPVLVKTRRKNKLSTQSSPSNPENLTILYWKLLRILISEVHLEYHKATNTLYFFRYPSFCAANLPNLVKDSLV